MASIGGRTGLTERDNEVSNELREIFEEDFRSLMREADVEEVMYRVWSSGFMLGFENGFTAGWENGRAGLAEEGEPIASDEDEPVLLEMALEALEMDLKHGSK